MAHKHSVYDTDQHFMIDPITRKITNQSSKVKLMQFDHNSERMTFEIPRFVDGHDMSLCTKVEVHYINISTDKKDINKDVYLVDDTQLSPDSDDVVIFSWLVSRNATQLVGLINFIVRFSCLDGVKSDYVWNTDVSDELSVSNSIDNGEEVIVNNSDILEAWKTEVFGDVTESVEEVAEEVRLCNALVRESISKTLRGPKSFCINTFEDLMYFVTEGSKTLCRVEDGVEVKYSPKDLDTGDTIYIKELDVPDFWWVKTSSSDGAYVYKGETLAHELVDRSTIAEKIAEIERAIGEQINRANDTRVEVNTEGEALEPDYSWFTAYDGSETNPYLIGSPAALLGLSSLSNGVYEPTALGETEATVKFFDGCYFVQTAHFDMGGITLTPIAWADTYNRNSRNYSRIYYDGRGHSISNFTQSGLTIGGLFGYIGSYAPEENKPNCYIKNLTLSNVAISATNTAGAIVAVVRPGVDIINCHTTDDVYIEVPNIHSSEIGGIVGYINEWNDDEAYVGQRDTRIAYCTNSAHMTGTSTVGGIVGYIQSAPKIVFEHCINYGNLVGKGDGTNTANLGGILGQQYGRSGVSLVDTYIQKCANLGTTQAINNSKTRCGGIIGWAYGYNPNYGKDYGYPVYTLEYCYDTGNKSFDDVGKTTRHSLISNCTGAEALKQYKYCHGAGIVDGLAYHGNRDFYYEESCSVVTDADAAIVDTFAGIICQLQPLESPVAEMQSEIEELKAKLREHATLIEVIAVQTGYLKTFTINEEQYYFEDGMTWRGWIHSHYNPPDNSPNGNVIGIMDCSDVACPHLVETGDYIYDPDGRFVYYHDVITGGAYTSPK